MGLIKTKSRNIKQAVLRTFLSVAGIALALGLIISRPSPDALASTDPGLDSGNATVDRTSVPGQTILKYTTTGNSTFKAPAGVTNVRVLVVGGGGGGGAGESKKAGDGGGGGGSGEYLHQTSLSVTPGAATTVTVGGGGAGSQINEADGGTTAQNGTSGSNSIFGALTARAGGGAGGNDQGGLSGGSGGGAGGRCSSGALSGGASVAVNPGVGNTGGNSPAGSCTPRGAAGGGGAGAVGTNGSGNNGGAGAIGLQNDITGVNAFYAGGGAGGGGSSTGTGANGGSSIGGNGGAAGGGNGTNAAVNTGSGGGGGGTTSLTDGGTGGKGGAGSAGVVIVRFATQDIPDPMGITGVRMWYKADSAGNTNGQWNDSSGLGYNMTQATGSRQPVLTTNAINFNPAYVFDGTDDVFKSASQGIAGNEPLSAFFGANATRVDGGWRYFNEFGDDTPSIGLNNGTPTLYVRGTSPIELGYGSQQALTPHVYGFISPNANNQSRVVGVDDNEQTQNVTTGAYATNSGGQAGISLGGTNGSSGTTWAGPIAEAIYFNRVLTPAERLKVASYLAIKYGVTRYQGTTGAGYADSNGATIWPADSTYKNNIAGIGRDDSSTLNQKQSASSAAGDIVTIGNGTIAASNQANTNNFTADRSFQLWGHNGAAINTTTSVTGAYVRMDRIWKTVKTGTVGQVKVQIPTSAVTGGNGILYTSSSTTFDAGATRTNMTVNGANYEATVTLGAGTTYFSFGSIAGSDIQFMSKTATDIGGTTITSYTPGESIEYKLTVKNNGPDNSGTVTVTDTLPAGIVPKVGGATGGGWNCSVASQTVTCTRPVLNSGATAPDITIEANIASNVTGSKLNTATASVSNDPDTSNNSASITLPAAPKADLSIAKSHTGIPTTGQPHTYKFTVTNNGPSDVTSFTVTDALDSNLQLASSTGNICSPVGGAFGQTITCTGGALTANGVGSTVTFDMIVNVSGSYGGGVISNIGIVAPPAGTTDPISSNNSSTDQSNVLVDTQLGIVKSHTGNFTAGVNNTFTLTVDNQGPSNSPIGSVTVTDTLDEDFAFVSATGTGWSCSELNGTMTCTNTAAINSGVNAPAITLTVLVDPIADGSTANTAEVSSTTPDSDLSDNSSTDTVTIESEADLGITKAHVGTAFTAGQQEQYTFSVVNNGPSADSPSYTITDTLPASLTFVSATGAASCSVTLQVVTCTGGAIGAGDPAQVTTITVAVNGSATGTIANTATVAPAAGVTDPTPGNNSSTDNVNVEPNADLSIVKAHAGNLTAGDNEDYTITVTNNGPSNVTSFTVTDTLDQNLTYQSASGATCGAVGQLVTCTGGAITSGNSAVITVTVHVESTATQGGTISNTATVAPPANVNDPTPGNNSSTVDNTVDASADLAITKSHTGDFMAGSNTNTFTIEVTNNGPSDASTFTVTDTLPTGLTYVDAQGTAGIGASCSNAGQIITCTGGPTIGVGQTSTITVTVAVSADTAGNTTYDNNVSVASATSDPNSGNNSAIDTATVDSVADLGITKTNTSDFTAGNNEDYQLQITNAGPSDVSGFTVSDTLPATLAYVSSSPNICSAIGQVVTCNGGAIEATGSTGITVTVAVSPSATGTVTNTATVAAVAPTTDPNNGNNSSTDPTNVVDVTDLSINKGHVGTFVAGESAAYTILVSNGGPSNTPTNDVTVSDTLPSGMTYTGFTGTGWSCNDVNRLVTCDYAPALAASGTTPTLTINVDIDPSKQGEVINTATVESILDDSSPPNDSDSDTTTITAEADLTATKTPQGSLTAGQEVTYRFEVTNDGGPSVANAVTITDSLQGHYTYQGFNTVSGGTWDCAEASNTVTCDLSTPLVVGGTAIVDVTLKVAEDAPNPLANTAAVTFNGTDPTPTNPSDSSPVAYSADLEVKLSHQSETYHSGDTVKYTYTVINHGPSTAKDVVLTDTLPEGLSFESIVASAPTTEHSLLATVADTLLMSKSASAAPNTPFNCSNSGQSVTCNASTLAVGTYTITMTAKIAASFTGNLTSVLQISASTSDPNSANNTSSDTIFNILAARGLVGTGQDLFRWLWLPVLAVAASGGLAFYGWKRFSRAGQ